MAKDLLETAIAEAYASAPAEENVLFTLELNHPAWTEPVRVVHWPCESAEVGEQSFCLEAGAPRNAGEYVPFIHCGFTFKLPNQSKRAAGEFTVVLENANKQLMPYLEEARRDRRPIEIIYREFLASEPQEPGLVYDNLYLRSVKCSGSKAEGTATFINWLGKVCGRQATPTNYPGLVRGR